MATKGAKRGRTRLRQMLIGLAVLLVVGEVAGRIYLVWHPETGISYLPRYAQACVRERDVLEKDAGERDALILLFGASTMEGVPFDPALTPVKWLDLFLDDLYPGREVDLVNFGHGGAASPYLAAAVEHGLQYEPDLVVVMVGNNEFLRRDSEPGGLTAGVVSGVRGTALGRLGTAASLWVRERVRTLRLYREVKRELARDDGRASEPPASGATDELDDWESEFFRPVDEPRRVPDSARSEELITELRANLISMIDACRESGVPILVASPAYNVRYPPRGDCFRAKGEELEQWKALTRGGLEYYHAAEYEAARDLFLSAQAIDETNAQLAFHLANCLEQMGDVESARYQYELALHFCLRRARMFDDVEAEIRSVCDEYDVPYMAVQEQFSRQADNGVVDFTFLVDKAHPTLLGQYLLARELLWFVYDESDLVPAHPGPLPRDFETLFDRFELGDEFEYSTNRRLGDYHRSNFEESLEYYEKAFATHSTPEICLRVMDLCRRHDRYDIVGRWADSLAVLIDL